MPVSALEQRVDELALEQRRVALEQQRVSNEAALQAMQHAHEQQLAKMTQLAQAEREIIRDPKTGKATGARIKPTGNA